MDLKTILENREEDEPLLIATPDNTYFVGNAIDRMSLVTQAFCELNKEEQQLALIGFQHFSK
jgi:hypothetical protein